MWAAKFITIWLILVFSLGLPEQMDTAPAGAVGKAARFLLDLGSPSCVPLSSLPALHVALGCLLAASTRDDTIF